MEEIGDKVLGRGWQMAPAEVEIAPQSLAKSARD